MALADQSITAFLAATASDAPAPGAGSGAALAMAIGLACARKAIALTLRHRPDAPGLADVERHLAGLVDQALAGAEADAQGFDAYITAMQRPSDEPDRGEAEEAALTDLVAVGENLVAIGAEARAKLLAIRTEIYPAMANDIAAALALIAAAGTIHQACAAENARALNP